MWWSCGDITHKHTHTHTHTHQTSNTLTHVHTHTKRLIRSHTHTHQTCYVRSPSLHCHPCQSQCMHAQQTCHTRESSRGQPAVQPAPSQSACPGNNTQYNTNVRTQTWVLDASNGGIHAPRSSHAPTRVGWYAFNTVLINTIVIVNWMCPTSAYGLTHIILWEKFLNTIVQKSS